MKNMQSRFFCTECGREGIPISRKQNAQRESGHLKKLYCIFCKKENNHAEVKEIGGYTEEDFKQEFILGRFKEGLREPINKLAECTNKKCTYNINQKCWNANHSYYCRHREREEVINNENFICNDGDSRIR